MPTVTAVDARGALRVGTSTRPSQGPVQRSRHISGARTAVTEAVRVTSDPATARAFVERLYAAHHAEIYAYLGRMVRDDELAADLTQETFVKAYRAFDTLEDHDRARAWLYQIAGRTALDELRRRKIVRFVPWTGESRGAASSRRGPGAPAPALRRPRARAARIPPRQRQALLLSELHDLTGLELAEALGVSHVAARALLTRGRESLRQALAVERASTAALEEDSARRSQRPRRSIARDDDR